MERDGVALPDVRRASAYELNALAALLARAFDDDPVSRYLIPDQQRRPRGLRRFFAIELRHTYLPRGEAYTTPDHAGASLWTPPGTVKPGWRDLLHLLPMVPIVAERLGITLAFLGQIDAHRPKGPHWYLGVVGTEPALQGRGIGSAVLRPVLDKLDDEKVPAYLESSKERNVPFYRRHGWEVIEELRAPKGGPTLWLMWREPR